MFQSIKMQITTLFRKKSVIITYFLFLALVLWNYLNNIIQYHAYDIMQMFHPLKIVFLSDWSALSFYFAQCYPLIVIIPVAFSYLNDKNSKELIFIQSRVGKRNYFIGRFVSAFVVTFFVFTIPLLLEVVLNCISFPLSATGDPSNYTLYSSNYQELVGQYIFRDLWISHEYLYVIFLIFIFGLLSSTLATFALACSTFSFVKYKIFVFIPVYFLLYIVEIIGEWLQAKGYIQFSTNYFYYLRLFSTPYKSGFAYLCFIFIILLATSIIVIYKIRKDEIL